jgi:hypothetical protein
MKFFKKKEQANRFLHKIYRYIEGRGLFDSWVIKFDKNLPKNVYGAIVEDKTFVIFYLNPRYPVVKTFLHECLHYFFEYDFKEDKAKYEKRILCMEDELMFWLGNRQLENLFIKMSEIIRVKFV